jgi:hypothetical protein
MLTHELFEAEPIDFHAKRRQLRPVETKLGQVSYVLLGRDEPEWQRAWDWLKRIEAPFNYDIDNLPGEQWQYMGTEYTTAGSVEHTHKDIIVHVADGITGEGYYHNFRIRWHPVLKQRVYRHIPAKQGWKPSYEDVLRGKEMMDRMHATVDQMAKDHPDLLKPK